MPDRSGLPSAESEIKRLGYLSGAPRVTTADHFDSSAPRSHVLGVIQAFESLGWKVHTYIVGDRLPRKMSGQNEVRLEKSHFVRLAADLVRLALGIWHGYESWRELRGKVHWVYERFAVFQALGWIFQRHGIPWILETNGLIFYEATTERKSIALPALARVLELWAYRKCDVLICITEALKELIVEVASIPPEKILVVPNGVDVARFHPPAMDVKTVPSQRPLIGFIGSLHKWHRLDVLLAASSEMISEGIEFDIVVVGDGPMREAWQNQSVDFGLQDYVRFIGQVPWNQVPEYISRFDLAYMGYSPLEIGKMYGSPLKLYEYMAMARTVISSACEDARDMITPGRSGYLFTPADKDDLKRVLHTAFRDRPRWPEIGSAARATVVEKASWSVRVQKMIEGIEQILEHRNAHPPAGR